MKRFIITLSVLLVCVCQPLHADDSSTLALGWTIGTLDNDLETAAKLWRDHGYMAGSNVECSDGNILMYVDEDGSLDFEGNLLPSEAAGIIYSLDEYSKLAGTTIEVELELPACYPVFEDGIGVAQTLGIFEKDPIRWRRIKGAFVNYGYCPGGIINDKEFRPLGGHHFSFGGKGEAIQKPYQVDIGVGLLDKDLVRQTVTIKMEIKIDAVVFSINGEAPYYIHDTYPGNAVGSDYELRIMTHAATVRFGDYDPAGVPYVTIVKSVRINGEEILLCSRSS